MKQVALTLTINVDDEPRFLEKHGGLEILEERVNDAIRWLDGVSVHRSTSLLLGDEEQKPSDHPARVPDAG